jgi:hypothetical protein
MPTVSQVEDDLRYVRSALEGSRSPAPASIYALWAVIGGLGMPLGDLAPRWAGVYWMVASPVGLLASVLLGGRHARRLGQVDRDAGRRHGLHWLALVVAIGLAAPLAVTGRLGYDVLGQVILLLLTVAYFLAGVHLDRRLLGVSALLAAGYLSLFVLERWAWTVIGLTTAAALAACAWLAREPRERAAG